MNRQDRLDLDKAEDPVLFYSPRDPYGAFSNFSPHSVWMPDPWSEDPLVTGAIKYPTGEHRFQAMKGETKEAHDYILAAQGPSEAKDRGRKVTLDVDVWGRQYGDYCWFVMFELVLAKAIQYKPIWRELQDTNQRHIYEDSPRDDIWGWRAGNDYDGQNLLGRCWMMARDILA